MIKNRYENQEIFEEEVEIISNAIKQNNSLESIDLSNCLIAEACSVLGEALKENKSIRSINVSSNRLGNNFFDFFTHLKYKNLISLDVSHNGIDQKGFKEIFTFIEKNENLQTLNLSNNGIEDVNSFLESLKANNSITNLNLSDCLYKLENEDLKQFFQILNEKKNLKSLYLKDSRNILSPPYYLCDYLKTNNTLTTLDISNNHTKIEFFNSLYNSLLDNFVLSNLSIGHKFIIIPQAVRIETLNILNLVHSNLTWTSVNNNFILIILLM